MNYLPPTYKNALEKLKQCQSLEPAKTETPWIFLRALARGILNLPEGIVMSNTDQVVPFWTGLQHMLSKKSPSYTIAAYVPVIDAKPSDISTIYTTMKRCQLMTRELQQDYVMQTMDQQLYCIAQQVKWSAPEEFVDHFVRLGGFHTLSTFIAAIGKLWGDAGLRDLLADSGVYAPCTVDQILSGKQFNRAVRGLTLVYEALSALWLEAFITWCNSGDHVSHVPLSCWELLVKTQGAIEVRENDVHLLMEELEVAIKEHFLTVMDRFDDESCRMSPTFQFWNGFRGAVQIMLQNIQSERNGDWDMTLHSQSKMLPYMFATNRTNYSRWLPVYLLDMLHLPTALQQTLKGGCFTVRQSPGKFNGVWSDMGVEKTIIKDCKGKGGIVGLTQQKSALLRWLLTRHVLAAYAASMHLRSGLVRNDGDEPHDECRPAAMKRDEDQVKSLREHVQQTMTNPFNLNDHPEKLMNISTGLIATTEVQKSLLGAVANGQQKLERVVETTLDTNRSSSLYAPIPRSGLKTFTDMTKKTRIKMDRGTLHVNISAESVFRRALTLSSTREDITTKKLLSLPIGPVPTALFHDDGTMRKCTKADLIHKLEKPVGRCIELPEFDACRTVMIRDVMAVIQALPVQQYHSFDDLAHNFLKVMCAGFTTANTIVDVFDRYDVDQSLKWEERQRRAAGIGQRVYQVTGARAIPPWKNFLSVSLNKLALQHFLTEFIVTHAAEQLANTNYKLYVAGGFPQGEHTKSVTAQGVTEDHMLYCTQEEADSRIFLHAKHTDDMFQQHGINGRIIIKSPDTDVIVLAIYYFPQFEHIQEMWVHAGSVTSITDHRRCIPIHEICRSLSPVLSRILPALHALSGCDTTSSFYGIGKRSVFKIVHEKPDEFADLSTLSEDDETVAIDTSRRLVLKLYSTHKTHGQNLDELRLKLASKKDPSLSRLPPCEKSFLQHVKRARWQCKVWTNSHVAKPDIGSPLTHGWKKDTDNHLSPMYYEGPMASEVIEGLLCNCKARGRCSSNCSCSGQGLPCTELCPCGGSDCKTH